MLITGPIDLRNISLQRLVPSALPRAVTTAIEPVAPLPAVTPQLQAQPSVAMLVVISASDPAARRRRDTTAADKGLRALEALHDELRVGQPSPTRLGALAAWMDDHFVSDDPAAAELLREVELRVLVELAKADRDK